jgi:glycosyltransferase involved in cell wall biosynthesis
MTHSPPVPSLSVTSLSVVIPAYNEEANVASAVERVSSVLQPFELEHEIIVVNDGSRDRTGEIVRELQSHVPHLKLVEHFPNRGYGGSLKAGFAAAKYEWIAFTPSDNQFDFGEIKLLMACADKADIVSGYRANRQDPFIRKLNALGWNTVVRLLFGYLCRDIDCGFKLFKRQVLNHVHVESNGAMIDTEFLAGARARGYKITDVPVTHLPRVAGHPTGANLKVIIKAFRDLGSFRLRLWRELSDERKA